MGNVKIRKAEPGDEKILAHIQTESRKAAFADILPRRNWIGVQIRKRQSRCTQAFSGVKAVIKKRKAARL